MLSRLMLPLLGLCFTISAWGAQTCNDHIPVSTPTKRFTINADNTITDIRTGLTWKRCLEGSTGGQCEQGKAKLFSWQQALQQAASQSGWRLPNIKELASIVELKCYNPAINLAIFPALSNEGVWSSSPNASGPYSTTAWYVYFYNGYSFNSYDRSSSLYVRLVHDISSPPLFSAPQNVVTTTGDGQITLTWDAVNNANSYQITNEAGKVLATTVTGTTYTFTGLTNNQIYSYRIAAQDATGKLGTYTAISYATPKAPTPTSIVTISKLNDTGITWGADYPSGNNTTCIGDTIAEQDCSHGRDVTHNDDSDGHAGFSFTKIDENGNDLPATASTWACVRDNVTGFMWEVNKIKNGKIGDEGLHDADDEYTWYNTNNKTNGGAVGSENDGGAICHAYQANNPASYCNTEAFVNRVNKVGLCGHTDWSIPHREVLLSIVDYSRQQPAIDINYFPNNIGGWYWSSSPSANNSNNAWLVSFYLGGILSTPRDSARRIQLVRGGQ